MYGIVKGNELNRFLPQNSLTRAEMATIDVYKRQGHPAKCSQSLHPGQRNTVKR